MYDFKLGEHLILFGEPNHTGSKYHKTTSLVINIQMNANRKPRYLCKWKYPLKLQTDKLKNATIRLVTSSTMFHFHPSTNAILKSHAENQNLIIMDSIVQNMDSNICHGTHNGTWHMVHHLLHHKICWR